MKLKGKIKVIKPLQQVSASFEKQELVLETNEQYPQTILMEFQQGQCVLLEKFSVGDEVEIDISLRGRCWQNTDGVDKYFNTIVGYKINKVFV